MTDEHPARREPVPARAALRRPDHPAAIGDADQLADCGHDSKVKSVGRCCLKVEAHEDKERFIHRETAQICERITQNESVATPPQVRQTITPTR